MAKKKGGLTARFLGSIAKLIITIFQMVFTFLAKLIWKLGLLFPLIYLLFGWILSLTTKFKLFDFSLESILYIVGLGICCFCSVVISFKNLFVKPTKAFKEGYKEPIWKKKPEEDAKIIVKPEAKPKLLPFGKKAKVEILGTKKYPKKYYSSIENDTLIYEYEDRFEVFKVGKNGDEYYVNTEYKTNNK